MLTFSLRDRDRLAVLRQVREGLVTPARGAELLGAEQPAVPAPEEAAF